MKRPKENLSNVYRFLKHFELTASAAFQRKCDSKAALQLVRFAEKILYPKMPPSMIRMNLSHRWQRLKKMKRGDYDPVL